MAAIFLSMKSRSSALLMLICIAIFIRKSNARPPWLSPSSVVFTESAECHTDDELLDLCQRCAKLTKSKMAYPACCSTDLEARRWCSDYVYFGRAHYGGKNEKNLAIFTITIRFLYVGS